jgi:hypothetical protein
VPLLALVRDTQDTLREILAACQAPMPVDFHFEFKVGHRSKGRGKPSHTDLMAISDTACMAIEAKWTEPPYESVASWLLKGTDKTNRKDVLQGWLALLSHGGMPVSYDELADCEYQMLPLRQTRLPRRHLANTTELPSLCSISACVRPIFPSF